MTEPEAAAIMLNGKAYPLSASTTLAALVERVTGSLRGSAVAVDGEVVPRARWAELTVPAGATVEVITAVQGG